MFVRLLLTAMLATMLAFAQRGGGMGDDTGGTGGGQGGGMGGGTGDDMGTMRIPRQTPFDIFAERLKLNKDQKTEAQTVLTDAMKESMPLRQQMLQGRVAIANAIIGGKSEDDLKKMMDLYTSLVVQVTGIETKAFSKVCATLKPNQQGKAGPAFAQMAVMFSASAGGGGGRRGRN